MTKRILDPTTLSKLGDLQDHFEVCDQAGKRLGYFIPAVPPEAYVGIDSPESIEELDRREREDKRYTTAEVLERLRQL
jgi:hypothetical protein